MPSQLTLLGEVSPTNYCNLGKIMMLSLMLMSQESGTPLYIAQVLRVLREMAMQSGGYFDYSDFRRRLTNLRLDHLQTPFLAQRLDPLNSYLDLSGQATSDYFVDGGIPILDLSCPFVDRDTTCVLFRISIDLFLHAHPSCGKLLTRPITLAGLKYITDTPTAKDLTETFLIIIRQQRHLGVRTIISTLEPVISPKLIDLCSTTIIHRFTSPNWYTTVHRHIPIENNFNDGKDKILEPLYQISSLRAREAIVFAPSAHLLNEEHMELDTKHHTLRMAVRNRITWDDGRTIVCVH
ncbi:hypothetical protein BDV06DRAFT_230213 [Aspergillus oleicola]